MEDALDGLDGQEEEEDEGVVGLPLVYWGGSMLVDPTLDWQI